MSLHLAASTRRHDVDALRAGAVLLLIVFHTARLFDSEVWHMKDLAAPYWGADFVIRLLNIWQMPLLFLLAGMSAAWALDRRTRGAFVRERAARLLVPLAVGMVVLVAPQVWLERTSPEVPLRMSPIDFDGPCWAFLGEYFRCCYPSANLSWHHLWFLPYLFVYGFPLVLVARTDAAGDLARWCARAPWRLLLLGVLLFGCELALRPSFSSTHDLVTDWANHAHYGLLVLFGWWFARHPTLEEAIARGRRLWALSAVAATALWLAALGTHQGGFALMQLHDEIRLALRVGAEWCTLLAALAYGRRWLDRPLAGLALIAWLTLPFYLLHQTIIVVMGWAMIEWVGASALKFMVITVGSLTLSAALAWLGTRSVLTRVALGLQPRRGTPISVAAGSRSDQRS